MHIPQRTGRATLKRGKILYHTPLLKIPVCWRRAVLPSRPSFCSFSFQSRGRCQDGVAEEGDRAGHVQVRGQVRARQIHGGSRGEPPRCATAAPVSPLAARSPVVWLPAQVVGVLKGYDALLNLVLDEAHEYLKARRASSRAACDLRRSLLSLARLSQRAAPAGPDRRLPLAGRDAADGPDGLSRHLHHARLPDRRARGDCEPLLAGEPSPRSAPSAGCAVAASVRRCLARTLLHHRPAPCRVSQEEGEEEGQ